MRRVNRPDTVAVPRVTGVFSAGVLAFLLLSGCAPAESVTDSAPAQDVASNESVEEIAEQLDGATSQEVEVEVDSDRLDTCTTRWDKSEHTGSPAPTIGEVTVAKEGEESIVTINAGNHTPAESETHKLVACLSVNNPDGNMVSLSQRSINELWVQDGGIIKMSFDRDMRDFGSDQFTLTFWYQTTASNTYYASERTAAVAIAAP